MTSFLTTQKPFGVTPEIGNDPNGQKILFQSDVLRNLQGFQSRRNGQLSGDVWRSSRTLLGYHRSESNRKCLSASKGTRETQPSMAITRANHLEMVIPSPMRRLGVGAFVVVRGRESRPHGEGRQEVSFWTTERFFNREGFR